MSDVVALHEAATREMRIQRAEEVEKLKFYAIASGGGGCSYGLHTPNGPLTKTLVPIHGAPTQVAVDPRQPKFYAPGNHAVVTYDEQEKKWQELALTPKIPRISWLHGIAFDTKRNRLVATTGGGSGYVYAYYPDQQKWEVLAQTGMGAHGLVYVPSEDAFYGIGQGNRITEVAKFSPDGVRLAVIPLSDPICTDYGIAQMLWADGNLIVVSHAASPLPFSRNNQVRAVPHSFVIDAKSGEIKFSTVMEPH
jgi:hypothetical protein